VGGPHPLLGPPLGAKWNYTLHPLVKLTQIKISVLATLQAFRRHHFQGETTMHWAVAARSWCTSQLLEFLWIAGAKEGVKIDDGVTPLRTVIRSGKIPLANNLIQFGEGLDNNYV